MVLVLLLAFTLQSSQAVALKRFEVLRVDPAGMERLPPSLRAIFRDPVPGAEPVDSLDEAVKRAGFDPRLPKSTNTPQFGVMDPVHAQITIGVADLNRALTEMKGTDVAIPQNWDGITIGIEQGRGILADYGDFFITQAPALTLSVPAGFPFDQFVEVLSRAVGMNAAEARTLSRRFAANPAVLFPISVRYDMDIREVRLNSGPGLLLQNASKIGELALAWSSADRSYFVTGQLTEAEAIDLANSIQ